MRMTLWKILLVVTITAPLPACGPLLVGGGAAVVADEIAEQEQGGDGLF